MKSRSCTLIPGVIAIIGLAFSSAALAQQAQSQEMTTTTNDQQTTTLAPQELDSLVAPIALYPDSLLAQTLAASTYPLEVVQLQQWMNNNKNLQDKALADAVAKQPWDPSVQSLVMYPDVVLRMGSNIQWMTDLGNAFLAQQSDVMDAVQRMRAKAQGTGNLKTSDQSVVKTETVSSGANAGKQVIEIQQANPDVAYVPSYDPTVVYGAAPAQYPYYPYTYPGYVPGTALAWGAGIALGAAAWGSWGGWGGHWGDCDWNGGNVHVNNNNNFNKNNNFNRNVNRQGGNWQHNPQHRGNAPYGNRQTANKFGGQGARGAGGAGRAGGVGGVGGAGRPGGVGGAGRPGGVGGAGGAGRPGGAGGAGRPGGAGGAGARPGGGGAGARAGGAGKPGGAGARPGGGTKKNQVGNRSASSRPSSGSRGGGFSGGSGNHARASSNRGGRSMGGGGYSRGGGGGGRGGGGMSRGGGGGRGGGGLGGPP